MTINELQTQINKELRIDKTRLDEESMNNVMLIQKYLDLYFNTMKKLSATQREYDKLHGEKMLYYKHDYKFIPENAAELKSLLLKDSDLISEKEKVENVDVVLNYLKEVIQNFRDRAWAIKNAIDWRKFTEGVQ